MQASRLIRATGMRQAAVQSAAFLLAFLVASVAVVVVVRGVELRAARAEVVQLEDDTTDFLRARGTAALVARLQAPRPASSRRFRLEDPQGRWLAGDLPRLPVPAGAARAWVDGRVGAGAHHLLALVRRERNGLLLTVGEDLSLQGRPVAGVFGGVIAAVAALAGLGLLFAALNSRRMLSRVDAMRTAVNAYANGERSARLTVSSVNGDELDDLSACVNRMMEREERLIDGLRQVSSSLAHDLRRPLARHNQRIAEVLSSRAHSCEELRAALVGAAADIEEVLDTFQALLHIAELEAGAPGLVVAPVDLVTVARNVTAAYTALAEQGGHVLELDTPTGPVTVQGEARVIGRMLANLVENGLVHTPAGTRVIVRVDPCEPKVEVSDDGPGVSPQALDRLFERFFRTDSSRSTPGTGLGLSLAAAACSAFGGTLTARRLDRGISFMADFTSSFR